MDMSPDITELLKALSKAQGEFENAKKGSVNPHFRNKYADLAEIINSTRDVLSKHGLSCSQLIDSDEKDHYVVTILGHVSGQWIRSRARLILQKQDSQGIGSATTYMRRYSLAAILGISQEDDDGNAASQSNVKPALHQTKVTNVKPDAQDEEPICPSQMSQLLEHIELEGEIYQRILKAYKISSLDKLPKSKFNEVLDGAKRAVSK